jgi:hypothetical protein
MTKSLLLFFLIAGLSCSLSGQSQPKNPPSDSELAAISARGRALAEYDAAAWHSSDVVEPLKPSKDKVQFYVARKTSNGWVVMWGRFNEPKTKFLIVYEAQEGASPAEYKVVEHEPPMEDGDVYLRAAKAHELAAADFLNRAHPDRPYNVSVLPAQSGDWSVYFIPSQTEDGVLPYGADVRYTVSANGEMITERRQMHETLLESSTDKVQLGVHTHVLSDMPEDSDVFYAMSLNAVEGNWIVAKERVYTISPDGSIKYLGKTEDVLKMLQNGKFAEVIEPYRSMAESLMDAGRPPDSVVAFLSLSGARCDGKTPLLKFSILVNNRTRTRIILNRRALWNAQVRFGATNADILGGKYEKIVLMVPDKTDYSDKQAFFFLGPGMVYHQEKEYPVIGADLKGKSAVQFLFFMWPPLEEDQIDAQRTRWSKFGYLFTDDVETPPAPLNLDSKFLDSCGATPKN